MEVAKGCRRVAEVGVDAASVVEGLGILLRAGMLLIVLQYCPDQRVGSMTHVCLVGGFDAQQVEAGTFGL